MTAPRKHGPPSGNAPSALLLLTDRVEALEEALAGLLHTYPDQQGRLARMETQVEGLVAPAQTDLVPVLVTPQVAAALANLIAFIGADPKFAYDVDLAFRRFEKIRNGPLTQLRKAMVEKPETHTGVQVEDGT